MVEHVEITIDRRVAYALLALLVVLVLLGLGALGRSYTPDPARVIGWTDWKAVKVERQYRRELARLREDLAGLADLLQADPDPVRAELAATRLAQHHADGLGLLANQRQAVLIAADAVRGWAAGYAAYEDAVATVNEAMEIVNAETEAEAVEAPQGGSVGDGSYDTEEWWSDIE
jgi:hypothetical protein